MSDTTYRLRLPYPTGGDPVDVPGDMSTLSRRLDAVAVGYEQGAFGSRPDSIDGGGRLYYATDEGTLYYDTGYGWIPALWQPGDVRWTARPESTRPGWLYASGVAVSRVTYSALFAAIGTTYGAGDGSTTFNLPDLQGRVPVGAGPGTGLTNRTIGARGGAEQHRLHVSEMPSHRHNHRYMGPAGIYTLQAGSVQVATGAVYNSDVTDYAGGDGFHNNLQPYLALYAWVKT